MSEDKSYYSIGKVSALCNVPIKTLRYYDTIGLLVPDYRKDESNYRYYTQDQLLTLFIDTPEAIAYGVQKCRVCVLFFFLLALSHCLAAVLRGAGKAVIPMAAMLICWCLIRVSILEIAVPIYRSIAVVNWVYPITWCLSAIFLLVYYFRADWVHAFERS